MDWTNKEAYSLDVQGYQGLLEEMERDALDDPLYPRRDSRPDEEEGENPAKMMVALTELLAVLLLAICQHVPWQGKVVLYMGDNQVVIRWLNSRQARHPFASYLLQVLAAVEACYGFFLHTAHLRTYHNVKADALTRQDAQEVMKKEGLAEIPDPSETLRSFLDRGWQRRALAWAGQTDADAQQAQRLAEARKGQAIQPSLSSEAVMRLTVMDLSPVRQPYHSAFLSYGAQAEGRDEGEGSEPTSWRASRPGKESLDGKKGMLVVCGTVLSPVSEDLVAGLLEVVREKEPPLVWVDSRNRKAAESLGGSLRGMGYTVELKSICGRTLKDQVWWQRWVVAATRGRQQDFPWVTADDEPCTEPLAGYSLDWYQGGGKDAGLVWEEGLLRIDSTMPYLGATKPKPAGVLTRPGEVRSLVWDPKKPLPGLHEGSWEPGRKDKLLLLGKGPDGPAARTITATEVCGLMGGRKLGKGVECPKEAITAAPHSLAKLAVAWSASQAELKVGVWSLPWEEETEQILLRWLKENPALGLSTQVGGKEKNKGLPEGVRAMKAMCYVLRIAAGTAECPINEEGWAGRGNLIKHEACKKFKERVLWQAIEDDAKSRVLATVDNNGDWWVAAWSGHVQDKVVGPAAIVPAAELPKVLVHESYRRHTASIQKNGLLRQKRDLHFHDPEAHSEKWRLDLETRIDVDVLKAVEAGCVFRKTGNDVWLCDRGVPSTAIMSIKPWDDLGKKDPPPEPSYESASSNREASNPAALDLSKYRSGGWSGKLHRNLITEELVQAAQDLGKNLSKELEGGLEVDPLTEELKPAAAEARFAPGGDPEEFECDWSPDDSEIEMAEVPAIEPESESRSEDQREAASGEGEKMGEEAGAPQRLSEEPASSSSLYSPAEKKGRPRALKSFTRNWKSHSWSRKRHQGGDESFLEVRTSTC